MATTSTTNTTMNPQQMSQIQSNQPPMHPPKSLTPNTMNSTQHPNHYDPNHNQMMNHPMPPSQYNLSYHQQRKFFLSLYLF